MSPVQVRIIILGSIPWNKPKLRTKLDISGTFLSPPMLIFEQKLNMVENPKVGPWYQFLGMN